MVQGGQARLFGPAPPTAAAPAGPQDYRTASTHVCPACRERGEGVVAVAFNGCIYNHRELRQELEGAGHVFESDHADTEVILHGWKAWSFEMASRLDGMYAFIGWDGTTGQLFSGRDLAGEKPLYEWVIVPRRGASDYTVAWASTASAILKLNALLHPEEPPAHNPPTTLPTWIERGWGSVPCGAVYQHEPRRWSVEPNSPARGGTVRQPAWRTADMRTSLPESRASHLDADDVDRLLQQSVTQRLESDVPLACFLSGGVDSSLIAHYAQSSLRSHGESLQTFSMQMPVRDYDESRHAELVAAHLGTDHTTLTVQPSPASDLIMLIEQLGLPLGDSSLLPTYWLSRATRQHVAVAIAGDGGDELFGGYARYQGESLLTKHEKALRRLQAGLIPSRKPKSLSAKAHRLAAAARGNRYFDLLAIFPSEMLSQLIPDAAPDSGRLASDALRHDFEHYLPEDLLRKVDTASMAVALEVRAPFLSRVMIDAGLAAPLSDLMPRGERKGLLKQVARRHLPAAIVDRPKMGFAIPIGDWFRTDHGHMRQLLHDHLEAGDPFPDLPIEINMSFVRRMLAEHDAAGERSINPWHGRDHAQRLYMLLVLSIWARWLKGIQG